MWHLYLKVGEACVGGNTLAVDTGRCLGCVRVLVWVCGVWVLSNESVGGALVLAVAASDYAVATDIVTVYETCAQCRSL